MIIPCCNNNEDCSEISWLFNELDEAFIDTNYSERLYPLGVKPPYYFYLAGGELPPGLTLSEDGVISGIPTETGEFEFTIQVADWNRCTAMKTFTITVDLPGGLVTEDDIQLASEAGDNYIIE